MLSKPKPLSITNNINSLLIEKLYKIYFIIKMSFSFVKNKANINNILVYLKKIFLFKYHHYY